MDVCSGSATYQVGDIVAKTDVFNLYKCKKSDSDRELLFQIAATLAQNGLIYRSAFILAGFKRKAEILEEEYQKVINNPEKSLGFRFGFPELVESFMSPEQDNRRVNILGFQNVFEVGKMVPLINLTQKDQLRVDTKTSAWIMGKTLKMLDFVYEHNAVSVGGMGEENILIEPDMHYVVIFDFSRSTIFADRNVPRSVCQKEISEAAEAVLDALGRDPEDGSIPQDESIEEDCFNQYIALLQRFAAGDYSDAAQAHGVFYRFVEANWKGFHPFTTYPL